MRILVLTTVFPNVRQPEFGRFVRERVRRVAASAEVQVVAPVPWFPGNRVFRPRWTGVPAVETQHGLTVHHPRILSVPGVAKALDGVLYAASLAPFLRRLRTRFAFDVIDAHFAYPDGLAAVLLGRLFGRPVTVTLRGTIVPLSRYRARRPQIAAALRAAARVIAVSESLRTVAVGLGIDGAHVSVIPNGVDLDAFQPRSRAAARQALGLPLDRTVILSVGSLAPRKGHERVLDAVAPLVAARPDLLYVVVGGPGPEGDTGPALRRRAALRGIDANVVLAGARPHAEIPTWLNAADLFCLATSNEGRANVLLEAQASGVPVVTTDVGGSAEIVRDGHTGFLVPPGDAPALAAALARALGMSWDAAAIAADAQRWSWSATTDAVHHELAGVVGAGAAR